MQNGEVFIELFHSTNPSYRFIPAELAPRTWDHTQATCYYVGDSQGGPSHSRDPVESVIEGNVYQYETNSLFATSFMYSNFEESICDSGVV